MDNTTEKFNKEITLLSGYDVKNSKRKGINGFKKDCKDLVNLYKKIEKYTDLKLDLLYIDKDPEIDALYPFEDKVYYLLVTDEGYPYINSNSKSYVNALLVHNSGPGLYRYNYKNGIGAVEDLTQTLINIVKKIEGVRIEKIYSK